jgi:hypothetical protein
MQTLEEVETDFETNVLEILEAIDESLNRTHAKTMVPASYVCDMLLDIRVAALRLIERLN